MAPYQLGGVAAEQLRGLHEVLAVVGHRDLDQVTPAAEVRARLGRPHHVRDRGQGRDGRVGDQQERARRRHHVDHARRHVLRQGRVEAEHLLEPVELDEEGGGAAGQDAHQVAVPALRSTTVMAPTPCETSGNLVVCEVRPGRQRSHTSPPNVTDGRRGPRSSLTPGTVP